MKILNYGSMNIDHVYRVDHSVVPGETIIASSMSLFCGGKGLNQSIAVAKAGGMVFHAGLIGDDGMMLVEQLRSAGADITHIAKKHGASCHTIIQVDKNGQNSIVVCNTPGLCFSHDDLDAILADFGAGDILMLQNELQGSSIMMQKAFEKGMTVVFNPSPMNSGIQNYPLQQVHWLILNELEGASISGYTQPEKILQAIHNTYPGMNIILTLGEHGSVCLADGKRYIQPAYPVHVVDTTAAGDTFTGYFVTALAQDIPVDAALKRASIAASITVGRNGAAQSIPTAAEVDREERRLLNLNDL